jgi:hypothetical protein
MRRGRLMMDIISNALSHQWSCIRSIDSLCDLFVISGKWYMKGAIGANEECRFGAGANGNAVNCKICGNFHCAHRSPAFGTRGHVSSRDTTRSSATNDDHFSFLVYSACHALKKARWKGSFERKKIANNGESRSRVVPKKPKKIAYQQGT